MSTPAPILPPPGSSGVPLVDRPKASPSAPVKAKPPGLSRPTTPFAARALRALAVGVLVSGLGGASAPDLPLGERLLVISAALTGAALVFGFSAVVGNTAETAHWAKHSAEIDHRAEVRSQSVTV